MAYISVGLRDITEATYEPPSAALYHEATHARHYALDQKLSPEWHKRFPIPRQSYPGAWVYCESPHIFRTYAAFDYNIDPQSQTLHECAQHTERLQSHITSLGPYRVAIDPSLPHQMTLPTRLLDTLQKMPQPLLETLPPIIIHNIAPFHGQFTTTNTDPPCSPEYKKTAEDIAVSVEQCILSLVMPDRTHANITKLQQSKILQDKVRMLLDYGFLPEKAKRILDPSWREMWCYHPQLNKFQSPYQTENLFGYRWSVDQRNSQLKEQHQEIQGPGRRKEMLVLTNNT